MNYTFKRSHIEAFVWLLAIAALAFTNPLEEGHASLCIIKNTGLGFCPGCGLGHSISWLFRGNLEASFHSHPLGIPATLILLTRSLQLLKKDISFKPQSGQQHGALPQ